MAWFTCRFLLASHSQLGFILVFLSGLLMAQGGCEDLDEDGDGWTVVQGDCDDQDANTYPGAIELCDGLDNDCDELIDNHPDGDGDGYLPCDPDEAQVDCDDTRAEVYPGAEELCDGLDNNCDGAVDEGFDQDGDGWTSCTEGTFGGDCDDGDDQVHPEAEEVCDGLDNNCSGGVDDVLDGDGDGVTVCAGDCDDGAPFVYPGAVELCDEGDNDCDGEVDEGLTFGRWYVKAGSLSPSPEGQSWEDAYGVIQEAADAAEASGVDCKSLWVSVGTYRSSVAQEKVLEMTRGLQVYGGFAGDETRLEDRAGRYEETILDGDYEPDGGFSDQDSMWVVAAASDVVLDGFQITGGDATRSDSMYVWGGGGIRVVATGPVSLQNLHVMGNRGNMGGGIYGYRIAGLRMTEVVVEGNHALGSGGGMMVYTGSDLRIEDCRFEGNIADDAYPPGEEYFSYPGGGGLDLQSVENITITGVVFAGNTTDAPGGGLNAVRANNLSLSGLEFRENQATSSGGGARIRESSPVNGEDLWFEMNAALQGGGLRTNNGDVSLRNVVFLSNYASGLGGGIHTYGPLKASGIRFVGNIADEGGGMKLTPFENIILNDVEFVDNEALSAGGAILGSSGNGSESPVTWYNNATFVGNTAPEGAAISNGLNSGILLSVTNAVFSGNTGSATSSVFTAEGSETSIQYSCFAEGEASTGEGNIEMSSGAVARVDLDSDGLDEVILTSGSACIDAGSDDLANEAGLAIEDETEWWQARSTAADCQPDLATVDMGWHHGLDLCVDSTP